MLPQFRYHRHVSPASERVKHGGNEIQMIGTGVQIYICLQTVHIRQVTQFSISTQFEGCRQRQFQAREDACCIFPLNDPSIFIG